MKYKLIHIEDGKQIAVDGEAEIKEGDWMENRGVVIRAGNSTLVNMTSVSDNSKPNKIVASNFFIDKSIPMWKDEQLETLAGTYASLNRSLGSREWKHSVKDFIAGYKANTKQYTEEDLKEALRVGVNIGMQNAEQPTNNEFIFNKEKALQECKDYIKSLQPQTIEFEMYYTVNGKELNHGNSHITPSLTIKTNTDATGKLWCTKIK